MEPEEQSRERYVCEDPIKANNSLFERRIMAEAA